MCRYLYGHRARQSTHVGTAGAISDRSEVLALLPLLSSLAEISLLSETIFLEVIVGIISFPSGKNLDVDFLGKRLARQS